jgi:aryl-alcohol dehydrogenase-like predicted oxidoreductase
MSLPIEDFATGNKLLREAFELGVNYFDTADLYDRGANEELLGKAIADFRKEVIVATKVGNTWKDGVEGWSWNPSKAHIFNAVDQSLKRLRTDYIDLYQLHGGTSSDNFEEIVEVFELLQQQRKIRYYGLSSIRPNVFTKYLTQSAIVSNMMQFSALDTRPAEYLQDFVQAGVSIVARGSLAQGLLTGKQIHNPYLQHSLQDTLSIQQRLIELSTKYGVSEQSLALKYVLDQPAVASAIVGIRTREQLKQLAEAIVMLEAIPAVELTHSMGEIPKINYQNHRS